MRELMEDEARAKLHANFLEQVSEQFGSQASEKGLAECFDWITADSARSRSAGGLATLAGVVSRPVRTRQILSVIRICL